MKIIISVANEYPTYAKNILIVYQEFKISAQIHMIRRQI